MNGTVLKFRRGERVEGQPTEEEDARLLCELRVDQSGSGPDCVIEAVELQSAKRVRSWAKIPHDEGIELARRLRCPALAVLLALDRAIFTTKRNPTKLTNNLLRRYGVTRQAKARALGQLQDAGVVVVERRGKGAPMVMHRWHKNR
jgi:hypothetical protein